METRPTNVAAPANPTPARYDAAPVREAVRADLPAPQSVSAMVGAEQTAANTARRSSIMDRGQTPILPAPKESLMETDRETGDLIYKVIDPETRKIVTQYPAEALLRLRAYIRAEDQQIEASATP